MSDRVKSTLEAPNSLPGDGRQMAAPKSCAGYRPEDDRLMYDFYLRHVARQQNEFGLGTPRVAKPPATHAERLQIRERYAEKAKLRQLRMYEEAVRVAEEREREDGRRHRCARNITFCVHYSTNFGQNLAVVGNTTALGSWNPNKAVPLKWTSGNYWIGPGKLSTDDGVAEYKYLLVDNNFRTASWEPGCNHRINTAQLPAGKRKCVEDQWGCAAT